MKIKILLVSFLMFLSLILNGLVEMTSSNWIQATSTLFVDSEGKDGGFSLLIPERSPSLYETVYVLELLKLYNYAIPRQSELKNAIRKMQKQQIKMNGIIDLLELKYFIKIQKRLNIPFKKDFRSLIINVIENLDHTDGLYHLSNNDSLLSTISITEACVEIFTSIGYLNDYTKLRHTLIDIYNDIPYANQTIYNASKSYNWTILNSLHNIEVNLGMESFLTTPSGAALKSKISESAEVVFSKKPTNPMELFNDVALYELATNLGFNPILSEQFINYLLSYKNEDGGYGPRISDVSDIQMTVRILAMLPKEFRPDVTLTINTIKKHQLENGLFISRTAIKSNLVSSYMALKVLTDLSVAIPLELKNYFSSSRSTAHSLEPKDIYLLNNALKILDMEKANVRIPLPKEIHSKEDLYSILLNIDSDEIKNNKSLILSNVTRLKNPDGGFGVKGLSDFEQTYLVVLILNKLDSSYSMEHVKTWLTQYQREDGGFSLKTIKCDLIDTYFALNVFEILDSQPQKLGIIRRLVRNIRLEKGGFTFVPGVNQVSISSTFYGCEIEKQVTLLQETFSRSNIILENSNSKSGVGGDKKCLLIPFGTT